MKFFRKLNLRDFRSKYRKVVNLVAMIVVFATTYALILPAITLESDKASQLSGISISETTTEAQSNEAPPVEVTEATSQAVAESSAIEQTTTTTVTSSTVASSTVTSSTEASSETETSQPIEDMEEEPQLVTELTTLTSKGNGYELTAEFDASARFPKGVELKVRELNSQSEEYKVHYDKAKETLRANSLSYARFFDIQFLYGGNEVEPAAPVKISIKNDKALQLGEDSKLKVVHFEDTNQVEVIKSSTKEENKQVSEVSFQADSFSVYGDIALDFYTVKFVMLDSDNVEQEIDTLVDIAEGATVKNLPDVPFKAGFTFKHWIDRKTGDIVTAETLVTEDMVVEAVFEPISIYTIKVNYFYQNKSTNQKVVFDSETFRLDDSDIPYRITPPASIKVYRSDDPSLATDAIYYPQQSVIEITQDQIVALANQEDKTITVDLEFVPYTAEYDYVYLLKDLTGDGYSEIERVRAYGNLGSTATAQILNYSYADFEKTDPVKITQKVGQELKVYYTRKSYTLSYQTNGGSYIEPQTGLYKEKLPITSVTPTKEGYTFAGWYTNKELTGSPVTGSIELTGDQRLYAKWEPKIVPYTVVYFKEVYDTSTGTFRYVYQTTASKSGTVGTTVQASTADSIASSLPYHQTDTAANGNSSVVIKPDGSSVLNVYYKLKRYTLRFDLGTTNAGSTIDSRLRLVMNGQTYTKANGTTYEIKDVVLGQYIAPLWPSSTNEIFDSGKTYGFIGWYNTNNQNNSLYLTDRDKVTEDIIKGADSNNIKTFTAQWQTGLMDKKVEYYLQSADNPNVYDLSDLSQSFKSLWNSGLGQKSISGFIPISVPAGQPGNTTTSTWIDNNSGFQNVVTTYRFYYQRETYTIDYFYKGNRIQTTGKTVRFEQNINTPTYNYIPPRPATVDPDYTWGGWYSDPDLRSKYTFGVMPPNNLALYANWVAPSYPVTFDLNGGIGTPPPTQKVEKYKTTTVPTDPTRDYFDFVGWYTQPTGGTYYDWSKPVTGPVTLYARWKLKPLTYTVKYLEVGTNNALATEKVVTSPAFELGQTISEDALAITGYRPDSRSKNVVLDYANNEIIFYYESKTPDITYTIKYVLATDPKIEVAPSVTKTVPGSTIRVKESALKVNKEHFATQPNVTADMLAKDYYPVVNLKTLILSSNDANNILVFEYKNYDTAKITVNYLDMDGNPIPGQNPTIAYRKKLSSYIVTRPNIAGYTYEKSLDNNNVVNKQLYQISDTNDIIIDLYYKKNLTLTATNKSKIYNGQTLESAGLTDINSDYQAYLEPGDTLESIAFAGSQTDVGQSETTPKDAVLKSGTTDRNYFYNIQYTPGVLTVTPQPVIVHIAGEIKDKIYDGKAETIGYSINSIEDSSGLFKESMIVFNGLDSDKTLTKTDAGEYILSLQNRFSSSSQNFAVVFRILDGRLTIGKRHLILTSDSASKDYDGSELRADNITVSVPTGVDYTGFVDGEGVVPTFLGGPTKPGFMANYFNYKPKDGTNLANYELDTKLGQLKVKEVIEIQKTDLAWQALSGGKFGLTKWDGHNWAQVDGAQEVDITSKDGNNIPVGLEPGLYRLQELAAPNGFIVLDNYIYFTIKDNFNEDQTTSFYTVSLSDEIGNDANPDRTQLNESTGDASHLIKVANEKGRALPNTGGSGRKWIILSGLVFMVVSLVVQYSIKQRRERGGGR
ncbi:InlB B-repeat-containing protein [Streptococcus parasuis]|uniref:InlB B-repeat-containing protein n=1 Tax=Streptococcus parasuis TaxID=1501662 RepID=UPI0025A5CF4E|nr:InlB B-repeat-containing protein [Streptococcus parasuis]WJQ84952.1 InlB B-repeat-containing protein [Streptococcus parasuis]